MRSKLVQNGILFSPCRSVARLMVTQQDDVSDRLISKPIVGLPSWVLRHEENTRR